MKILCQNKKGLLHTRIIGMMVFIIFIVFSIESAFAQVQVPVKAGRYWSVVTDHGGGGNISLISGWFPADYNVMGNDIGNTSSHTGSGICLFMTDWKGIAKAGFVPRSEQNTSGTVVVPLKSYVRYGYPSNTVNFKEVTSQSYGEINSGELIGTADQVVTATHKYACDVQAERKILAWSQDNHNNYIIADIVFKNVGNQVLNNFYIGMHQTSNDVVWANGNNPEPADGVIKEGTSRWYHYYGARVAEGDSQRVFYSYDADDPRVTGDDMGSPAVGQDGRLLRADFQFYAFLHVSKMPYINSADDIDDPLQPTVSFAATGQVVAMPSEDSFQGHAIDDANWYDTATGRIGKNQPMSGQPDGSRHRVNSDELGSADFTSIGEGIIYQGFEAARYTAIGPYTFQPGESIHVVYASGAAGIGLPKAKEVGAKWLNHTLEAPSDLPNPTTGYFPDTFKFPEGANQWDINKDLWISTGIDSVHKIVYRAKWNFDHNYQAPLAPPPPSLEVTGFPDKAQIRWSDTDAEAEDNFAGYRVMRRVSNLDTSFFEIVHTTSASDKSSEHVFDDTGVKFGASYYYYVQAATKVSESNLNATPEERGKLVWSSRLLLPNPESIEPPRASSEDMSKIRIVPNPYNINDPLLEGYGWPDFRGLLFFNIPPKVTIKIFTESGDLVQTLQHDSPIKAGSLYWDMLTSSQQVISSGVYIAVFQDPEGQVAYRKFVVAR